MLNSGVADIFFQWPMVVLMYSIGNYMILGIIALVLLVIIIALAFKKTKQKQPLPPKTPVAAQPLSSIYPTPTETVAPAQPPENVLENSHPVASFIYYLIWGLISVGPVTTVLKFFICFSGSCGSDTPGINIFIGLAMLVFWILVTAVFMLFAKKILNFKMPKIMFVIWITIFIAGYFLSGWQAENYAQKSQQTLEDFKKNEITEITSPNINIVGDKLQYDDGKITFYLPKSFVAINGRAAVPPLGEEKVIGFTDHQFKIRIVWTNNSKCTYKDVRDKGSRSSRCETILSPSLKESKNTNGVIIRSYDLSDPELMKTNHYFVSLDKTKFDTNNYLDISYDGNYQQNQYEDPSQSFITAYDELVQGLVIK